MEPILSEVKQALGIGKDDAIFDPELLIHINSINTILTQIGVGLEEGRIIDKDTTLGELVDNRLDLQIINSYIYLRVRLLFDPPQNSFLVTAINEQIKEYEWRISVQASSLSKT